MKPWQRRPVSPIWASACSRARSAKFELRAFFRFGPWACTRTTCSAPFCPGADPAGEGACRPFKRRPSP